MRIDLNPPRWLAGALCAGSLLCLVGCASLPVVEAPSANHNSRVQHLVLHFTSLPFDQSLDRLTRRTDRPVSSHYLVPEPGDATYPRDRLRIYRLVPEARRAWHAGRSTWRGRHGLNDSSIGIEIVNRSHCGSSEPNAEAQTPGMVRCTWFDFPQQQIDLVIRLARDILARHPDIDPVDVVAHSDIAPARRSDPGPTFPWKRLHDEGIGAWFDEATADVYRRRFERAAPTLDQVQQGLSAYGYAIDATGEADLRTGFVVRAFQLHFRPSRVDAEVDVETAAILFALLDRYRPDAARRILNDG